MPELRGHLIEENHRPAGYAWLTEKFDLKAPLRRLSVVSTGSVRGNRRQDGLLTVYDKRYWPGDTAVDHLDFAMKHEPVDLLLLKKALQAVDRDELTAFVKAGKFSASARRIWFMYEWFTGERLDLDDLKPTGTIDMLDPVSYYALDKGSPSTRHRLRNNLPGTRDFCAIARRAEPMDRAPEMSATAKRVAAEADPRTLERAAAFMLMSDSKSTFEIEGETPPRDRLERWGKAVGKAGTQPLSVGLFDDLQKEIIEKGSLVTLGLRTSGVWLGDRDRERNPKPDFVGARPDDLASLMEGMIACDRMLAADKGFNPLVHAAGLAFGFVYVHPYQDGNGRLHRYLIQHVLAERKFPPDGVVLPVSAEILASGKEYFRMLRSRSGPLMEHIEWKSDEHHNVVVTGDTADLYRYPDVSDEAAFLAKCVGRTVEHTLPDEIAFLESYDQAMRGVTAVVDMPNNQMGLLILQTVNNKGFVPKKRRRNEYQALSDDHVGRIEAVIREAFRIDDAPEPAPPAV